VLPLVLYYLGKVDTYLLKCIADLLVAGVTACLRRILIVLVIFGLELLNQLQRGRYPQWRALVIDTGCHNLVLLVHASGVTHLVSRNEKGTTPKHSPSTAKVRVPYSSSIYILFLDFEHRLEIKRVVMRPCCI
jgi:hypothetical protein